LQRALADLLFKRRPPRATSDRRIGAQHVQWFAGSGLTGATPAVRSFAEECETEPAASVVAERFLLTVLRNVRPGVHPAVEIGRFLSERVRFPSVLRLAGWIEGRLERDEVATLALLVERHPQGRSAAACAREALERHLRVGTDREAGSARARSAPSSGSADEWGPIPVTSGLFDDDRAWSELLGRRTAELHVALTSDPLDPAFAPERYSTLDQRSAYQSLRSLARSTLRHLAAWSPRMSVEQQRPAARILEAEARILARLDALWTRPLAAARTRHHGDYRLERVIAAQGDFWIGDFAGEPTRSPFDRRHKQSPLRDVAGMLQSIARTATRPLEELPPSSSDSERAALERGCEAWRASVSEGFLHGYLELAGCAPFLPQSEHERRLLLDAFELEVALREVAAGLERRAVPLSALHALQAWLAGLVPLAGVGSA
jgi:maltose alpha-D-glucosyltransferase/alpha-amylase